jgi:tricorn protease
MRIHARTIALVATLASAAAPAARADIEPNAGMLRYPDVGSERIVFVYANDLWTVDREGGLATPLASPPGGEAFPKFSADGQTIAFMGNYDGGRDLYSVPVGGGVARRLTHHPAQETLCDWTPGGRLLFYARGMRGVPRASQLFTVSAEGGLPEQLPVPYGAAGAISPDGEWLAYTPHTRDQRTWKRYRGGMATDIWLLNLRTHERAQGHDVLPLRRRREAQAEHLGVLPRERPAAADHELRGLRREVAVDRSRPSRSG